MQKTYRLALFQDQHMLERITVDATDWNDAIEKGRLRAIGHPDLEAYTSIIVCTD